jgi:hypothetical protein
LIISRYLIPFAVSALAVYLLTPRGFEPGGETWGAWAAARNLSNLEGFPVFSRNLLYVTYLTLFNWSQFPNSFILEYWITHLFVLISIYTLLITKIDSVKSLIMVVALAPLLAVVEGGGTLAAIGFFSLYLRIYTMCDNRSWPVLPASLFAAALCHSVYLPFVILHLLASVFRSYIDNSKFIYIDFSINFIKEKLSLIAIICIAFAAILFQSDRAENNHMLMDPRFAPIPLSSALNIAFFQIKTWDIVERTNDPSLLYLKDWFFEVPRIFGNSKTIIDLILSDTNLFFEIIFKDLSSTLLIPLYLFSFYSAFSNPTIPAYLVSMIIFLILVVGAYKAYRTQGLILLILLVFGCGTVILAFLMTWFSFRYLVTLLPIFLVLYIHYLGEKNTDNASILSATLENKLIKNGIFLVGCSLLLSSAPFASSHYQQITDECTEPSTTSIVVRATNITCKKLKRIKFQINAVIDKSFFLKNDVGVSMFTAFPELSLLIDENTRILSLEHTFFSSFTKVQTGNSYQVASLPPFEDSTQYTANLLNKIDIFFVSDHWVSGEPSVSTQSYLRYILHVLPYLNAKNLEFQVIQIPRYGKAYIRRKQSM